MNKKLTLSLEESAIEKGKRYASRVDKSLSQLVCDYFIMLDASANIVDEVPVSRKLESLVGVGAGPVDEHAYRRHLERKHGER